jgi:hypothetical protein
MQVALGADKIRAGRRAVLRMTTQTSAETTPAGFAAVRERVFSLETHPSTATPLASLRRRPVGRSHAASTPAGPTRSTASEGTTVRPHLHCLTAGPLPSYRTSASPFRARAARSPRARVSPPTAPVAAPRTRAHCSSSASSLEDNHGGKSETRVAILTRSRRRRCALTLGRTGWNRTPRRQSTCRSTRRRIHPVCPHKRAAGWCSSRRTRGRRTETIARRPDRSSTSRRRRERGHHLRQRPRRARRKRPRWVSLRPDPRRLLPVRRSDPPRPGLLPYSRPRWRLRSPDDPRHCRPTTRTPPPVRRREQAGRTPTAVATSSF